MRESGEFYGIGVGPGPKGFLTLAAFEALNKSNLVYCPYFQDQTESTALTCLKGLDLSGVEIVPVPFKMSRERDYLNKHYRNLAKTISFLLSEGKNVAFLTLGDPMTYSTYGYLIEALKDLLPNIQHTTFPGVTSYAAVAAKFDWTLGEGKERILILPCPDDMEDLRAEIEGHDIVVLMKIGKRLSGVLKILKDLHVIENAVFAKKIGMEDEELCTNLFSMNPDVSSGYLSTILIRKTHKVKRHLVCFKPKHFL